MSVSSEKSTVCVLCEVPSTQPFCCLGCQTVYQILTSKGEKGSFKDHPLFQQALKTGLISNPKVLEGIQNKHLNVELQKLHLEIGDMWCPSCAEVIRLILLQEKGVNHCVVDYATDLAVVEFAPRYIAKEKIYEMISSLGYKPISLENALERSVSNELWFRFGVGAFFALNIMMFSYPIYASHFHSNDDGLLYAWLSFFGALPVVFYSGWPIIRRFWTSLQVAVIGMEALVVLGITAAFGLSFYNILQQDSHVYFDSMTTVIVLVLLGKIIESKAKFSAKNSVLQLTRAMPRRFRNESGQFILLKDLVPGNLCVVLQGEKIPVDGVVVEGEAWCDESLMTGEALPIYKKKGLPTLAGSILTQGKITIRATARVEEMALSRILNMVSHDLDKKSTYTRAADAIVRWFVPAVIAIAVVVGLVHSWLAAISVLLISCPCAIGIAAPLAEAELMNSLAKLGVIVRNRACLSFLGRETCFVFDKTGTITTGKFRILKNDAQELAVLKALTGHSNHPIAVAIHQAISEDLIKLDSVEEIIGQGLRGMYKGREYRLGSKMFTDQIAEEDDTTVFFTQDGKLLSTIILGDLIREEAAECVSSLPKTLLLSGDGEKTVANVAQACNFTSWKAECNPLQKKMVIEELRKKGEIVCMVGDGINDALALTAAHVGISVISATDISIQVSDILLTTDKLRVIGEMCELAKKGNKILKQNLFWAFFYNVIGIGLAAFDLLTPIFAAFAMVISSIIVILNSKRLKTNF